MALDVQELIPALSSYRVGTGTFTAEIYHVLSLVADELLPSTPGKDLGSIGKALLIIHLFDSRPGDLDKSSMNILGTSWTRNAVLAPGETSAWVMMKQLAAGKAQKANRGSPLVERNDTKNDLMRIDNAELPQFAIDVEVYKGG